MGLTRCYKTAVFKYIYHRERQRALFSPASDEEVCWPIPQRSVYDDWNSCWLSSDQSAPTPIPTGDTKLLPDTSYGMPQVSGDPVTTVHVSAVYISKDVTSVREGWTLVARLPHTTSVMIVATRALFAAKIDKFLHFLNWVVCSVQCNFSYGFYRAKQMC